MFNLCAQHLAAATGFASAATTLLKLGATADVVDASGKTPAALAMAAGDVATTLALGGSGDQVVAAPAFESAELASTKNDSDSPDGWSSVREHGPDVIAGCGIDRIPIGGMTQTRLERNYLAVSKPVMSEFPSFFRHQYRWMIKRL